MFDKFIELFDRVSLQGLVAIAVGLLIARYPQFGEYNDMLVNLFVALGSVLFAGEYLGISSWLYAHAAFIADKVEDYIDDIPGVTIEGELEKAIETELTSVIQQASELLKEINAKVEENPNEVG